MYVIEQVQNWQCNLPTEMKAHIESLFNTNYYYYYYYHKLKTKKMRNQTTILFAYKLNDFFMKLNWEQVKFQLKKKHVEP